MKIGENGISTAAIVGIVVTVVVVTVGVAAAIILLNPGAGGVGNLPLYGGATKADNLVVIGASSNLVKEIVGKGNSAPSDVQAEVYTATGSVSEILDYYRTEMVNAGWTKLYDQTSSSSYTGVSMTMGVLYFEKGDRAATVCAVLYTYLGESYTYFGRMEGPKTTFDGWMSGAGYEWVEPTTTTPTTTTTGGTTTTTTHGGATTTTTSGGIIAGATSLDYKIDMTYEGSTTTMRMRVRNIGASNMDLRYDITSVGSTMSYILSGSQEQGWINATGQWMSFSDLPGMDFNEQWSSLSGSFDTYTGYLSDWTSGEWSETYGGVTYRIYDIQPNPTLPDSVFQPV